MSWQRQNQLLACWSGLLCNLFVPHKALSGEKLLLVSLRFHVLHEDFINRATPVEGFWVPGCIKGEWKQISPQYFPLPLFIFYLLLKAGCQLLIACRWSYCSLGPGYSYMLFPDLAKRSMLLEFQRETLSQQHRLSSRLWSELSSLRISNMGIYNLHADWCFDI